jgi:hypothetical protein
LRVLELTDKVDILYFNSIAFYSYHGQPQTFGRPGQGNNLASFQTDILQTFSAEAGTANFLRAHAQIADNFWRNSFTCVNLSLLALFSILPMTSWCFL